MHGWARLACGLTGLLALLLAAQAAVAAAEEDPTHADAPATAEPADSATKAHADETPAQAETADDDAAHDETAHSSGEHSADHGGHGDPHDLSHQNGSKKLEDPSEFKSDLAIWTFVVFLCLLLVLLKFAWRPIMGGLEKREQSIAAMIDEAKQSAENAAEQLRQYEARLAEAGEEARGIVAKAQRDAETAGERIVDEAQAAARRERERAVEDIVNAKNVALQEITESSVDLAVQMAGRIVRRQLKREDHAQLIREALDQLPSRN